MTTLSKLARGLRQLLGIGARRARRAACAGPQSVFVSGGSIRHVAFHRVQPLPEYRARRGLDRPFDGVAGQIPPAAEKVGQRIAFSHLGLERGGRRVLEDVDCVLAEHRIGILGLNGSGKSSLLKLMVGLLAPSAGLVELDGLDPVRATVQVRSRTGYLFQSVDNQIVYPIVREDLAFGLTGVDGDVEAVVQAALRRLHIEHLADRRIHELSGGERQLVALAGVLARDPLTVLFDEPTSSLDLANRNHFCRVLDELPQQAIVVTHDLDLVETFDRALVVSDGRVVFDGRPDAAVRFYRGRHQ